MKLTALVLYLSIPAAAMAYETTQSTHGPERGATGKVTTPADQNGPILNGIAFNGLAFNGLAFNGLAFNGRSMAGSEQGEGLPTRSGGSSGSIELHDGTRFVLD